jgi:hypothetical protein
VNTPTVHPGQSARPDRQPARLSMKNRWIQLMLIAAIVSLLAAVGSHLTTRWLGIRAGWGEHRVAGSTWPKPLAYVAGSSLLGDALDVQVACHTLEQGMQTWFVAGSSPCEWEELQSRAPDAKLTIVGISAYDLNEHFLSDYRAEIIPLSHTVRDLVQSRSSWAFSKRVVSQYPMTDLRKLFPTLGRSSGVMGAVRDRLEKLLRPGKKVESEAGPTVPDWGGLVVDPSRLETISDWAPDYLLRRLTKLRSACQGQHSFSGPKQLALQRLLKQARRQGEVVVLVLPVSPAYQKEFLDEDTVRRFEASLADHQRAAPGVRWLRVDQVPELNTNNVFWDVVHMNVHGKKIATQNILEWMRANPAQP